MNWLTEYNNNLFQKMKASVEEKGNRGADSTILAYSKFVVQKCHELLSTIDEKNLEHQINSFQKDLPEFQQLNLKFKDFVDSKNLVHLNLQEIKRRITLFELEALTDLSSRIGAEDLSFNKLDAYFIHDNINNRQSKRLKGVVILTAMSNQIGDIADFYFDNKKLEEVDGVGVVDISQTQLPDADSVELRIKFPNWEIKKKVSIK